MLMSWDYCLLDREDLSEALKKLENHRFCYHSLFQGLRA
jgi:hypothetical protein